MDITMTVSACPGQACHINVNVLKDGVAWKSFVYEKKELLGTAEDTDVNWDDVVKWAVRSIVKKSGATTPAQAKTAVEAASLEW